MQKICIFLSRDRAKFVPIVRVAGNAGGTTIVIRSSARTMMRCQASCQKFSSIQDTIRSLAYLQSDEVDERCYKTQDGYSSHYRYVPEGVLVELETRWFWKEHGANQSPFSSIEASPYDDRQSHSLIVLIVLGASCSYDLCAREQKVFCYVRMD